MAEARQVLHRPALAVARQAHHDGGRIDGFQLLIAEVPFLQHAGAVIFDDDVGVECETARDILRARILHVQREAFFVARLHRPPERGAVFQDAPLAQGVAAVGCFDLDHLGAEFGEHARAERAGDQGAEFEDFDAGERTGG